MEHLFQCDGSVYRVETRSGPDGLVLVYEGKEMPLSFREVGEGMFVLEIGGKRVKAIVDGDDRLKHVFYGGDVYQFSRVEPGVAKVVKEASGDLTAPLTGRVIKVLVSEGDEVDDRTQVMIIEAMKMEHKLRAPFSGVVGKLNVSEGDMVEGGQLVARIDRAPARDAAKG